MRAVDRKIIQSPAAAELPSRVLASALGALAAVGRSLVRRRAIFDLGRLDDRMLCDMGLTRADLAEASRWSLWGDPTDRLATLSDERRARRG